MPDDRRTTVVVEYGESSIPVALRFEDRDRLAISVHPDGSVTASAPSSRSIEQVRTHLDRRKSWIAKHRRFFEAYRPLPERKRFVSGETHLYLGRQYRLRVREGDQAKVRLVGEFFEVSVSNGQGPPAVHGAMDVWYKNHARPLFEEVVDRYCAAMPSLGSNQVAMRIQRMRRRWGSCSRAGTITLNLDLIKMPMHCIEYVVVHELCHLHVHDHSRQFFRLLQRVMPDWESRKDRLDKIVLR